MEAAAEAFDVSVLIPAFNSAPWLSSTLEALRVALAETNWSAEVIVIDDGSTDETSAEVTTLAEGYPYDLRIVGQSNQGVFMAVWNGLHEARSAQVLILNSRLLLHRGALAHLAGVDALHSAHAWNGHVVTDPTAPLIGRFWEVPTYVFWGGYLSRPRPTEITLENFDRVPKGTGCLLVPRQVMIDAYEACWPDQNVRFTSDDTKLLRHVCAESPIRLEPGFSATYRPRTTYAKFLAHAAGRGTMFVDSYGGTTRGRDATLIGLVIAPIAVLVAALAGIVTRRWGSLTALGSIVGIGVLAPAAVAAIRNAPGRAIASYLLNILPFGAVFWLGLARGVVLHRRTFRRRRDDAVGVESGPPGTPKNAEDARTSSAGSLSSDE